MAQKFQSSGLAQPWKETQDSTPSLELVEATRRRGLIVFSIWEELTMGRPQRPTSETVVENANDAKEDAAEEGVVVATELSHFSKMEGTGQLRARVTQGVQQKNPAVIVGLGVAAFVGIYFVYTSMTGDNQGRVRSGKPDKDGEKKECPKGKRLNKKGKCRKKKRGGTSLGSVLGGLSSLL